MTDLEVYQPHRATVAVPERDVVDGWLGIASDVIKLANVIAETEFVPKEYRDSPPAVAAAILVGRELGIGPMMSLRHVQIVRGVPTLSAEYKRARVLAAGHDFEIEELNTTRCRVRGRRTGTSKWLEVLFTIDDAKRAKIYKADGAWMTRPRRMLFARAGSELCDFLFADVTNGLPTSEIVADGTEGDEFAGYDEAPSQTPPVAPAPRTARRRQTATQAPAAQADAPKPSRAAQDASLPPLPGEDEPPDPTSGPQQDTGSTASGSATAEPEPTQPFDPDEHGTATKGKGGQLTAIWTILQAEFAFAPDQKDQARAVVEHIIGRELDGGTTGDLSWNEARTVLDTLSNWIAVAKAEGESPHAVMIAAMIPADQAGEVDGDG
jgi:hypothetical protein